MFIKCNACGKPVSTEIPDGTIIRAWIECPECTTLAPESLTVERAVEAEREECAKIAEEQLAFSNAPLIISRLIRARKNSGS